MSKRLVVALSGGVGGAKLALGLSRVLPADELLVVANTGDDFVHFGLSISPEIDTLTYTGTSGNDTRKNTAHSLTPSVRAASSNCGSTPSNAARAAL